MSDINAHLAARQEARLKAEAAMEKIRRFLVRVTYKPNVEFSAGIVWQNPDGVPLPEPLLAIHLKAYLQCSLHPGRLIVVTQTMHTGGIEPDELRLREYLRELCQQHERHELQEWFQVDGDRVFNPKHTQEEPTSPEECDCSVPRVSLGRILTSGG